ncbi:MAG TPA: hypothetical protein VD994_07425 [Prosthecobacter sp.]|nr:hypothetical protein [Prosthecobacter sp.]
MKILREFTSVEAAELARAWLEVFGKDAQGVNTNAYMWHVFSGSRYPALQGEQALSEYLKQICCEFVVLSNDRDAAYLSEERPDNRPFTDFYVFPPNLAWTMAFTMRKAGLDPISRSIPAMTNSIPPTRQE